MTNSERCITRVMPAVQAPGEARHDWEIVVDFARRLGQKLDHAGAQKLFLIPMLKRFLTNIVKAPVAAIWILPV